MLDHLGHVVQLGKCPVLELQIGPVGTQPEILQFRSEPTVQLLGINIDPMEIECLLTNGNWSAVNQWR
jgi:hypothetical protein